ncbi:hypothetical protein [Diaphorobacter sp. J5-51]|uniref:hypothetical protein n=1 Tax=Diaphorobacter sp. J5-51 TaxID=680496 RepID=UPI000643B475|nr:hypothetical protein [Diaphorobacter sp. J5-51]KLR56644.1 hypothetical protein OX89_16655 [Diaphorobacter sp. J5-51]
MTKHLQVAGAAIAVGALLTACGGGSKDEEEYVAKYMTGTAVSGGPMAMAKIEVLCTTGKLASTQADTQGNWQIDISKEKAPCAIHAKGMDGVSHYSLATDVVSNVNVTTLTDLALANAIAAAPDVWWHNIQTRPESLKNLNKGKIDGAAKLMPKSLGHPDLSAMNPVTGLFKAGDGGVLDKSQQAVLNAVLASGIDYRDVLNTATSTKMTLPPAFVAAYQAAYRGTLGTDQSTPPDTDSGKCVFHAMADTIPC